MKKLYLFLSVLGTILPFYIFVPWFMNEGLNLRLLLNLLLINPISQFFAMDFIISWIVFSIFIIVDSQKSKIQFWWIPLIGNCCVGLSFALPFYLFLKESNSKI